MVTIDDEVFNELQQVARARNISIQELFRVIIIPNWIERNVVEESRRLLENKTSYTQIGHEHNELAPSKYGTCSILQFSLLGNDRTEKGRG